jgi:hypothetical protein
MVPPAEIEQNSNTPSKAGLSSPTRTWRLDSAVWSNYSQSVTHIVFRYTLAPLLYPG